MTPEIEDDGFVTVVPDVRATEPVRCAECNCEHGGVYCNWIASTPSEYRAEIARLTVAHDTVCGALAQAIAERDTARAETAMALDGAVWQVRSSVPGHMFVCDTERICDAIRSLTSADATAALEAKLKAAHDAGLAEGARRNDVAMAMSYETGRNDGLREAAEIADDPPRPVAHIFRADGINSRHDKCPHELPMYEDCPDCIRAAILARIDSPQSQGGA